MIHNPALPVEYPAKERNVFAVVEIAGFQHKVVQDDLVYSEWLKDYDINDQICFDQVLLVGTRDYTAVGRPRVSTAKVLELLMAGVCHCGGADQH